MTKEVKRQENKMGVQPVHQLLLTTAFPIMVSMLVGALYNIVDSIFVAQISEEAFVALSLAFPFQNLMIAVGVGTGVGINALLSRSLGEQKFDKANAAATNGIFLGLVSYLFFFVLTLVGTRPFIEMQSSNPLVVEHGITYIQICGFFSFGLLGQLVFEKLLQSTGKTGYIIAVQGLGAVINIILDPIMIFGLLGFPAMGVAGAAAATVIAQIIAAGVGIYINRRWNTEIVISFRGWKPDKEIIKEIYRIGVPSIIMSSIGSFMVFAMNQILLTFSNAAAAALGAYFKVQSFVFMPVFGLTNAVIPIVSYNYGAKKKARIIETIKLGMIYSISIMTIGFIAVQLFPRQILGFFNPTDELMRVGVPALRIISISFILAGYAIVGSSVFQALQNGTLSAVMAIARQLVILVPVAYLLSLKGDVNLVWWSFPIAEAFAVVMCTIFLRKIYEKRIMPLPDKPPVLSEEELREAELEELELAQM